MRQMMLYSTESESAVEKRAEKAGRMPLWVGPMESPSENAINRTTSKISEIQMSRVTFCLKFKVTIHPQIVADEATGLIFQAHPIIVEKADQIHPS